MFCILSNPENANASKSNNELAYTYYLFCLICIKPS